MHEAKRARPKDKKIRIYTTGEEIEWRDEVDRTLGRFTYWRDNRKAGDPMFKTKFGDYIWAKLFRRSVAKQLDWR